MFCLHVLEPFHGLVYVPAVAIVSKQYHAELPVLLELSFAYALQHIVFPAGSVMLYVQNTGDTFSASFYSSEGWRNNPYLEVSYTMLESSLTCLLSETSVTYGASVFVSGTLTDTSTEAELSGRIVYLEYSQPEISDWEPLAIVTTGSPYNHTLTLNAGTWQIRARQGVDIQYSYSPTHVTYFTLKSGEVLGADTAPNTDINAVYVMCETAGTIVELEFWKR